MKEKKYKEAKQDYVAAKTAFDKAAGAVEGGKKMAEAEAKKVATVEANAAVASLEEDWKNVKTAAKNAAGADSPDAVRAARKAEMSAPIAAAMLVWNCSTVVLPRAA